MNKRLWSTLVGVILVLLTVTACAARPASQTLVKEGVGADRGATSYQPVAPEGQASGNAPTKTDSYSLTEDRKVIQTANLRITVKDSAKVLDFVQSLAAQMGGYIVTSTSWRENEQLRAQVTLRVPADQLPSALKQIRAQAVKVDNESVTGEDVTQEYTDTESRLRNLKATETELLELLAVVREKTGKAEDIMAIYRELTQIRDQIETLQGRKQYLDTMTAMATITVDIWPEPLQPIVQPGWKPLQTLREAFRTLTQTGQSLVDALIWLVIYVAPILAIIAAPIILIVWAIRRSRKKRATPAQ